MNALCIAKAGLIAGTIMGVIAITLNLIQITTINLTQYTGCMLTGKKSGAISMAIGLIVHLIMSVIFAFLYVWIAQYLVMPLTLINGALLGLSQSIIGGIMLPIMDNVNTCVSKEKVEAMGLFAQKHGMIGMTVYFTLHMVYGITLTMFL